MPSLNTRYLTVLIVFIVLAVAWLGRGQLAEMLIESTLPGYGLSDVGTDIRELGLKQSRVQQLGFTLVTDTGRLRLDIEDAVIGYDLRQLADGRVRNLEIGALIVGYESSGTPETQYSARKTVVEPIALIAGLRQAIREYILFDTFSVRRLTLEGDVFGPLQHTPLQLSGTNDAGLTHAEFSIGASEDPAEPEDRGRRVVLKLSEDHFAATLKLKTKPDLNPAEVTLNISDTAVDGSYSVEPDSLGRWLRPFTGPIDGGQTATIAGTLAVNFDEGDAANATFSAGMKKLELDGYSANNLTASLRLAAPYAQAFRLIKVQKGSVIKTENLSYGELSLPVALINVNGDLTVTETGWQYDGSATADSLAVHYASHTLPLNGISTEISADPNAVAVAGNFAAADIPGKFGFKLGHSFTDASGTLAVSPIEPIDLDTGDSTLSQLLTPWPFPFDLFAGAISLAADGAWSPQHDFRLRTAITLDDTGGKYRELVFSGLSTEHELDVLPTLRSVRPGNIVVKNLDSGVTASNISTRLTLQTASTGPLPQIKIQGLRGEIFDGSFSGDDFIFDLNRSKNRFEIKAENIDLARIVETQQLEDIVVTGRVDGSIPVEINDQGIFIEHGAFFNVVRTGTIRYNPAAASDQLKQNPLTGIALDALRDFRYSHLSADVNFTPEGILTIKLKLQGTSPELDTTRPVHLNINTEQNLLSLLKSLRYAEGISATIDKKVRRKYDTPPSNKQAR